MPSLSRRIRPTRSCPAAGLTLLLVLAALAAVLLAAGCASQGSTGGKAVKTAESCAQTVPGYTQTISAAQGGVAYASEPKGTQSQKDRALLGAYLNRSECEELAGEDEQAYADLYAAQVIGCFLAKADTQWHLTSTTSLPLQSFCQQEAPRRLSALEARIGAENARRLRQQMDAELDARYYVK